MLHFVKWHRLIRRFCILFLPLAPAFLLLVASCHDKGVEPRPGLKDFAVYFAELRESGPSTLFKFHPATLELDSVAMPWNVQAGAVVSPDGSRLYLGDRTRIVVADAKTLSQIAELPYPTVWPVAVSPDNRLVAITGGAINILRTTDYSVAFSDTDHAGPGWFSEDGSFFCCGAESPRGLYAYVVDLSDCRHRVQRKYFADGEVSQVEPSLDGTKWFLYLSVAWYASAFEVYDVAADSVIFRDFLFPGYGEFALSPDGRYVYYTNPGTPREGPLPPLNFTIFDVEQNAVSKVIYDSALFMIGQRRYPPNVVRVTPDNRWLLLCGGITMYKVLYLYDIENDTLIYRKDWNGYPRQISDPSVAGRLMPAAWNHRPNPRSK